MKNKILETHLLPGDIAFFYLGQMGYIIKYNDKYILTDGYLSDYVDRNCCNENVKWVRRYPAPISADELDFIDYVFCTHAHCDHADPYTLSVLAKINTKARFFVPSPIFPVIRSCAIAENRIEKMHCDTAIPLTPDISVTAIPSAHEDFHTDENGDYHEVGYIFELGDKKVFHAGDGCPYDGLESRIEGCDVLIMPVNGRDYYRRDVLDIIGCFDSAEAVTIAKNTKADLLIPGHFDLYDVNCTSPAHFVDTLYRINPKQKFHMFMPGERYIYR